MSRNNNPAGVVIGLLVFLYIGFVFFIPRMGFYPVFTIFPGIFILIFIASMATIISNKRSSTANRAFKNENQINIQKPNPYRVENRSQDHLTNSSYQRVEEEIEVKPIIRFCQYCGTRIERDSMFCHNCGIKLDYEV